MTSRWKVCFPAESTRALDMTVGSKMNAGNAVPFSNAEEQVDSTSTPWFCIAVLVFQNPCKSAVSRWRRLIGLSHNSITFYLSYHDKSCLHNAIPTHYVKLVVSL